MITDDSHGGANRPSGFSFSDKAFRCAVEHERAFWVEQIHDAVAQDLAGIIRKRVTGRHGPA